MLSVLKHFCSINCPDDLRIAGILSPDSVLRFGEFRAIQLRKLGRNFLLLLFLSVGPFALPIITSPNANYHGDDILWLPVDEPGHWVRWTFVFLTAFVFRYANDIEIRAGSGLVGISK